MPVLGTFLVGALCARLAAVSDALAAECTKPVGIAESTEYASGGAALVQKLYRVYESVDGPPPLFEDPPVLAPLQADLGATVSSGPSLAGPTVHVGPAFGMEPASLVVREFQPANGKTVVKSVPSIGRNFTHAGAAADGAGAVYVPVPLYKHPKQAPEGHAVSKALNTDLLGDSLLPTDHGGALKTTGNHVGHSHGYLALLFFFGSLAVGCVLQFVLERSAEVVPYTCALFIVGFLMGVFDYYVPEDSILFWPTWSISIRMWVRINPHLVFYTFLPALIFGEAMRLNVQLARRCFAQVLLLACPGVVVGTCLTACVARYVLPYGWNWAICAVFGAILSATDPVAVVALFNTLGVSERLTMLISGESLLNDGTAMVAFALMLKVALGAQLTLRGVIYFFINMTVVAVLLGVCLGGIAVFFLGRCAEERYHSDVMIQCVTTIACGYLAFFLAESEASTSGILTAVTAGVTIANYGWARIVQRHTMDTIWEAIEFIGNTLIFFLAGLLFANVWLSRSDHITMMDVIWLLVVYVSITLIRAFMVLLFWYPLNKLGHPLTWQQGVVMVWSGLRGAVGLAMAIIVDLEPEIDRQTGSHVMFYVGGIAALTTLINATTSAPLLRVLGLTKPDKMKVRMLKQFERQLTQKVRTQFSTLVESPSDVRFQGANVELVHNMVPILTRDPTHKKATPEKNGDGDTWNQEQSLTVMYREVFLRVVCRQYWIAINDGVIPRKSEVARHLLHSVSEALVMSSEGLSDWDFLSRSLDGKKMPMLVRSFRDGMSRLCETAPFKWSPKLKRLYAKENHMARTVSAVLCFQQAHTHAQTEVPKFFGEADSLDMFVEQQVNSESADQCRQAENLLLSIDPDIVELAKSKMLARKLLQHQIDEIASLEGKGVVTENEAMKMEHEVAIAVRRLLYTSRDGWDGMIQHQNEDKLVTQGRQGRRASKGR